MSLIVFIILIGFSNIYERLTARRQERGIQIAGTPELRNWKWHFYIRRNWERHWSVRAATAHRIKTGDLPEAMHRGIIGNYRKNIVFGKIWQSDLMMDHSSALFSKVLGNYKKTWLMGRIWQSNWSWIISGFVFSSFCFLNGVHFHQNFSLWGHFLRLDFYDRSQRYFAKFVSATKGSFKNDISQIEKYFPLLSSIVSSWDKPFERPGA